MAHYRVRYSLGPNNALVYPASVVGVAWTSTAYHAAERLMVGETDQPLRANGKSVAALKPNQAKKLIDECRASHPALQDAPWLSSKRPPPSKMSRSTSG